jgi:hypothetical protein
LLSDRAGNLPTHGKGFNAAGRIEAKPGQIARKTRSPRSGGHRPQTLRGAGCRLPARPRWCRPAARWWWGRSSSASASCTSWRSRCCSPGRWCVWGAWNLLVAAGALLLWAGYSDPRFNSELGSIVGLGTGRPRSIDYVPIFPWFAAVAAGLALGALWQKRGFALAGPAARLNERPPRSLVALGRWPLTAYLLHQPILLGALWLFKTLA